MSAGPPRAAGRMAPRRLLLTTDAVGGVWTYTLELAGLLAARGVAVELAVLGPPATAAQRRMASLSGVNLYDTGLELDWTVREPAALAAVSVALAALALRLNVDLVQLHSPALLGHAAWPAPVLAVVHSCVGTWWDAMRGVVPAPEDFTWRLAAMRHGLDAADAVIAPSRSLAEAVRRVYRTDRHVTVIPNGRAPRPAAAAAPRHGILTAGRLWDEGKNIVTLDRAAALLRVPVRAAGAVSGANGASITLQHVEVLGSLDDGGMAGAIASARIFAAPARYEPFGLAVLEAAQAGLPLVLADIPTFREFWEGAALFLAPDDAAAWAEALAALHEDAAQCAWLGGRAEHRSRAYTAETFGAAMWSELCRAAPQNVAAA